MLLGQPLNAPGARPCSALRSLPLPGRGAFSGRASASAWWFMYFTPPHPDLLRQPWAGVGVGALPFSWIPCLSFSSSLPTAGQITSCLRFGDAVACKFLETWCVCTHPYSTLAGPCVQERLLKWWFSFTCVKAAAVCRQNAVENEAGLVLDASSETCSVFFFFFLFLFLTS